MARRVSLPSADDLFGRSGNGQGQDAEAPREPAKVGVKRGPVRAVPDQPEEADPAGLRKPSGRVKHDEKMTVYITSDELVELEQARLTLRSRHGLAVDRGRMVREALALVLLDLEQNGDDSALVRRLTEG